MLYNICALRYTQADIFVHRQNGAELKLIYAVQICALRYTRADIFVHCQNGAELKLVYAVQHLCTEIHTS